MVDDRTIGWPIEADASRSPAYNRADSPSKAATGNRRHGFCCRRLFTALNEGDAVAAMSLITANAMFTDVFDDGIVLQRGG